MMLPGFPHADSAHANVLVLGCEVWDQEDLAGDGVDVHDSAFCDNGMLVKAGPEGQTRVDDIQAPDLFNDVVVLDVHEGVLFPSEVFEVVKHLDGPDFV